MSAKRMDELVKVSSLASNDLMLLYDVSEAGSEKTKTILYSDFETQISGAVGGGSSTPESLYYNGTDIKATAVSGGLKAISGFQIASSAMMTDIKDEDDMASNSATALVTQQSSKAYTDNSISTHAADTTSVHGITDTSDLALKSGNVNQFADITSPGADIEDAVSKRHNESHTIASHSDTSATGAQLNTLTNGSNADSLHVHNQYATDTDLSNHEADTTSVHGITDTSDLALKSGNVNQFADITSPGADIEDAVSKRHNQSHDNSDHTETYITSAGVTYENLNTNGDVGTGASQVAKGDHTHSGVYEPADSTILKEADVDDTPVNGATVAPVSSNWAYDHKADANAHHAESHTVASHSDTSATGAELNTLTDGSNADSLHVHDNYLLADGSRSLSGNLLPEMTGASGTVSTRNIGSSSAKFNNIYCHDLRADAGSVYVNDKKVIEDVSDVIVISTDTGQRLKLQTTGDSGDVYVEGQGGIQFYIPSTHSNKDITISNDSSGGDINIGGAGQTVKLSGDINLVTASLSHSDLDDLSSDDHTQYVKADGTRAFTSAVAGVLPTNNNHLATKSYVDGLVQGLDWQDSAKDKDLSAPPSSPSTGDRYIIGGSATDAWSGHDYDVTEWNGSSWDFTSKSEGMAVWVEDEDVLYTYNGSSWVKFGSTISHNNTIGLQGGTTNQYYHLTSAQHTDLTDGGDTTLHAHDGRYYTESEVNTWRSGTTQTEMGYVHGVTSDIQTQLNGKLSTSSKAADSDKLDGLDSTSFVRTTTNFGGDVSGTYDAIVVADDSHTHDTRYYTESEINTWRNGTTQTEMGYVHGITSDIQTQLNGKLGTSAKAADSDKLDGLDSTSFVKTSTNFGGDVSGTYDAIVVADDSHTHDTRYYTESEINTWRNGTTQTEMGYVHGVTSDIQTQLNGKLGTSAKAADSDKLDNHDSSYFAPATKGVTNGDSHDHSGGDGAQINHTTLSNIGTNTHATIDTHLASKLGSVHGVTISTSAPSGGSNGDVWFVREA